MHYVHTWLLRKKTIGCSKHHGTKQVRNATEPVVLLQNLAPRFSSMLAILNNRHVKVVYGLSFYHIRKESNMVRKMALGFDVPSVSHIFWRTHTPKA